MRRGRGPITALGCALVVVGIAGCGGSATDEPARPATFQTPEAQFENAAHKDDAEAGQASALTKDEVKGPSAPAPGEAGTENAQRSGSATGGDAQDSISPGAPTDDEIRAELGEMKRAEKAATKLGPGGTLKLTPGGNALTPSNAPPEIAAIIGSANAIARFPYVYGGGHGSFVDNAYDCSGSVSYALAGAGLLKSPLTSGDLAKWGEPGPGKWVTIYANAGHVFMYVAGTRYDTSGRSGPRGSRWSTNPRGLGGFTVRHPPGL